MAQVSETLRTLIGEVISYSVASWHEAHKEDRLPGLKTLVYKLQRLINNSAGTPPGAAGPPVLLVPPRLPAPLAPLSLSDPLGPMGHLRALAHPPIHIMIFSRPSISA